MIGLIDYGSGNMRSVSKALQHEGAEVVFIDAPEKLRDADAVVLPGVGAFGDSVTNLKERRLWNPLRDWLASGKPFLGICLGYQLLFESSEESPGVEGFGFFKGIVKRFEKNNLKIPQIGWNTIEITSNPAPLWRGLPGEPFVYFVHSYFPVPSDQSIIAANTTYGETFAASVAKDRVAAVQFHPEKSQRTGLTILRNFIEAI